MGSRSYEDEIRTKDVEKVDWKAASRETVRRQVFAVLMVVRLKLDWMLCKRLRKVQIINWNIFQVF